MKYSLLPFPTFSTDPDYSGLADLRETLRSRERSVAATGLCNLELTDHLVEWLQELPWHVVVNHCHEDDGRLHIAVMADDLGRNLEEGDKVKAGFFLQNCERASIGTLATTRVFRVACENGALIECEKGQSFGINSHVQPPTDWSKKIHDVLCRSFDGDGLDIDVARFHATTQQMIITPYEFLCHLSAQRLISDEEQHDIQKAFDENADFTLYGLINAVTQVAHRLRANEKWVRAFDIERLGGEILRGDHNLPATEPARSLL